jgi:hypothetical protein
MAVVHKERLERMIDQSPGSSAYITEYSNAVKKLNEELTIEERQELSDKVREWNERTPPQELQAQ